MFLADFDEQQKDSFLALAANILPSEDIGRIGCCLWREWLTEMDLPVRTRIGWDDAHQAALGFTTHDQKACVMLELARLTAEAPRITNDAVLGLTRVGTMLGMQPDEIATFRNWAGRLAALKAEAAAMVTMQRPSA